MEDFGGMGKIYRFYYQAHNTDTDGHGEGCIYGMLQQRIIGHFDPEATWVWQTGRLQLGITTNSGIFSGKLYEE